MITIKDDVKANVKLTSSALEITIHTKEGPLYTERCKPTIDAAVKVIKDVRKALPQQS